MALIKCSECGQEISDQATICPKCGKSCLEIKCPECGCILSEENSVCPECGFHVVLPKKKKGFKTILKNYWWISIILAVILIVVVISLRFTGIEGTYVYRDPEYDAVVTIELYKDQTGYVKMVYDGDTIDASITYRKDGDLIRTYGTNGKFFRNFDIVGDHLEDDSGFIYEKER